MEFSGVTLTHLLGEERLIYEQTSKDRRSSRPGGTPSGHGRRRCALDRPTGPRTPSQVVEIKRREAWRLEKVLRG
jgi:hypothetical protein